MNKTIYFDLTSLIEWKGNLTGIPRTIDELAARLRGNEQVKFIRWNFRDGVFEPVDINHYYEVIAPVNREYFNVHPEAIGKQPITFAGLIKKVIRRSALLSKVTAVTLTQMRGAKRRVKDIRSVAPGVAIESGAMLFLPCGLWDNQKYIQAVSEYNKNKVETAFLCYDLLPIVVPQFSGQWGKAMKDFTKRVTSKCNTVFCISEHTKRDLQLYLEKMNLPVPNLVTIRLGDVFSGHTPAVPQDKKFLKTQIADTKEDFILCTGTIEARKNHTLLYYTYKLAASRGVDLPKLIVAGRPGYRTQDIMEIIETDPEVNEKITLLKNVSDQELTWLYDNCAFSVYPSFYEGWGLPIAESVVKGVPCIASNISSMPEVAPGFVKHFNPASPEECLAAIEDYLDTAKLSAAKKQLKKYKPVSWDYTYDQVMKELIQ